MYLCELFCSHVVEVKTLAFTTAGGADTMCPICKKFVDVRHFTRDEWHSRCSDCSYSASHGMAKVYADRAAQRHQIRKPSHRVSVQFYNVGKGRYKLSEIAETVPTLFDFSGEPPY